MSQEIKKKHLDPSEPDPREKSLSIRVSMKPSASLSVNVLLFGHDSQFSLHSSKESVGHREP